MHHIEQLWQHSMILKLILLISKMPVLEKIWCVLGPEIGADTGKCAIVVQLLYGLKRACASF
jgi:hypothetical protein